MFPNTHYDDFQVEVAVLVAVSVFVALVFIFLLNLLIAQLNQAYHNMFEDIYGNARLTRAAVIVQVMGQVPRSRWQAFLRRLAFDQPLEFNEGDVGIAGGIQILEPASAKIVTSDSIRRFGGSTAPTMPWPSEETANLTDEDRFDRLEKMIAKATTARHKEHRRGGNGTAGSKAGSHIGSSIGSSNSADECPRVLLHVASFLNAADEGAEADSGTVTVEEEAKEVLDQAHAAETLARRAVRYAWGAVFICGIGVCIDICGASLDYQATTRAKEDLDEEEANLEALFICILFYCLVGLVVIVHKGSMSQICRSVRKSPVNSALLDYEVSGDGYWLATLAAPDRGLAELPPLEHGPKVVACPEQVTSSLPVCPCTSDLEPNQLSQLDSAAPWVLSPSAAAQTEEAEGQRAAATSSNGGRRPLSPEERLTQSVMTSSYPKLEGLQPEPVPPLTTSVPSGVPQASYQTLFARPSPRPYSYAAAPPPSGQPAQTTYLQSAGTTSYRLTSSAQNSHRENTSSTQGGFQLERSGRYSVPPVSSPTRHPGVPSEPIGHPLPLQPAVIQPSLVSTDAVQSRAVPDLRLRSEPYRPAVMATGTIDVKAGMAPLKLPGVVQNKLAASTHASALRGAEFPSVEQLEKPLVEAHSAAMESLQHNTLGTHGLPQAAHSPDTKSLSGYAPSNGGSSTARSRGSPRKGHQLPRADEGGSHSTGLSKRLSTGANDVVNARERYRDSLKAGGFFSCFSGLFQRKPEKIEPVDVILVGGGIMSATTGLLLKQLEPSWRIVMIERLDAVAQESSNAWNNAGTGHSALCEPNYTPQVGKSVDIHKAVTVNENFQLSRQYWAYLAKAGLLPQPERFIHSTPHMTFARGQDQIAWLKKRFDALKNHPLFEGMEYSEDKQKMDEWAPLMMAGRSAKDRCAFSRVPHGTDVDFGELTKELTQAFLALGGEVQLRTTVSDLHKDETALYDESWIVSTRKTNSLHNGSKRYRARFVFVGAGGYSLPLLQRSGIPEIRGFMGFPISGEFLVCENPEVARKHVSKVYGKAAIGAPPMSVPHLDARRIAGQQVLLFGPFAGFSPRFLKSGSLTDLFRSIRFSNIVPAAAAGLRNMDLSLYLIRQLLTTKSQKLAELREFIPDAKAEDWALVTAGQRVQIIKGDPEKTGILQFGTEVVAAADGTLAGLLGASPGASTAVQAVAVGLRSQVESSKS
ncbi:mqo [Symbiodinium pilosum]|uniref:Mqo protein n=1 Tax=Symbiodinium pilosum TaxID=2952 RepID=A0A812Y342_SYMPI|nr:mqo [Symbiodinium pilosum]